MMHGREKSDSAIVAGKPTNKAGQPAAEPVVKARICWKSVVEMTRLIG